MKLYVPALVAAAVAVAASGPAQAEEWRFLFHLGDVAAAVDADSIATGDGVRSARLLTFSASGDSPGATHVPLVSKIEVECEGPRQRIRSMLVIFPQGAEDLEVDGEDADWSPVPKNTPLSALAEVLCEGAPVKGPPSASPTDFVQAFRAGRAEG